MLNVLIMLYLEAGINLHQEQCLEA